MTGRERLDFVVRTLRAHADEFRARGVVHMAVFGSVARGEAREDSDVDLVVDMNPAVTYSLFDLMDFQERAAELLGSEVDLGTRPSLRPRLQDAVRRDAIDVF